MRPADDLLLHLISEDGLGDSLLRCAAAGRPLPARCLPTSPQLAWRRIIEIAGRVEVRIEEAIELAAIRLTQSDHTDESVRKYLTEIGRFLASSRARGASVVGEIDAGLVEEFLDEPIWKSGRLREPSPSTRRFRLSAVRKLYRILRDVGLQAPDPTIGFTAERDSVGTRPLTDEEVARCRLVARYSLLDNRGPAVLALAEAGATAGETAAVTGADVDLVNGSVCLGDGAAQRRNSLTDWGWQQIEERLEDRLDRQPHGPLVVHSGTVGYSATASVSGELRRIIDLAGLPDLSGVRPGSVRLWSASRVYEQTGDVVRVARWLGITSLDAAARAIGLGWQADK